MSRGLPVVVFENAAEPLFAADFAGLDWAGADWRPAHRRSKDVYDSAMKWLATACLLLCALCRIASSNLVFDGVHAFQYDGFGRVVQINRASLPANAPPEIASLVVGGIVKHYTYDAFGRLIRVQSPFPDPESGGDLGLRVERLYYDGLRRVQEVNIDPSVSMNMAMSGQAGGEMQAAANQVAVNAEEPLDGSAAPATLESQALESEVIPATVTYLAREYVWGPGDWGVDELLAQYDADRRASWPLQDAGGDVIALCDRGGANGTARVITQIVYDAYGSVIGRDDPYGTAASVGKELRVGHKGLFFDRLDSGISDPATGQETPRLWPGARLSGYARNRTLHCDFGRWNQPDPNMTGLPVQQAMVFHGNGLRESVQGFDLRGHFTDGANVYAYLQAGPFDRSDPLGLMSTIELGGVSGLQAMLAGMMNGVASVGTSISGMMVSGGIWTVNFTMSGALVVGMNFDAIMMFASNADANWNNWVNEFNNWGSGGGPQYDPNNMTSSQNVLARDWGVTVKQVGDAIHQLKSGNAASGATRNPDLVINRSTGDAFIKGTTEYVGNLKEILGL